MRDFDSLLKTNFSKRRGYSNVKEIYKQAKSTNHIVSLKELQTLNINDLVSRNVKNKLDTDLLSLWGMLDMKSYIDAIFGNTINPYFLNTKEVIPIKDLPEYTYLPDQARFLNLIDIKYIKGFTLEGVSFTNIFLATYEILDRNDEFRPYVALLTLNDNNEFVEFGYGYDTNDNGNVELFISSYNYLVYLTSKGTLHSPLSGKMAKLKVANILSNEEISKLYK